MSLTRTSSPTGIRRMGEPASELTRRLIEDGLKPATAPATPLTEQFFAIVSETLKRGAPGLTEVTRNALARSIALKCERAVRQQERAA